MKHIINAIYENGVFKPLEPSELPDGQHVRLTVETSPEESVEDLLELAAQVYRDLTDKQIDEIEQIALERRDFFAGRDS